MENATATEFKPIPLTEEAGKLLAQLGISLLASLVGIDSFSGFADFAKSHFEALQ